MKNQKKSSQNLIDLPPATPEYKRRVLLITVFTLLISSVLFLACLFLQIHNIQAESASQVKAMAKSGSKQAEEIDLAGALRKQTVNDVYEGEAIPAYSYEQCWNLDVSKPSGVTVEDLRLVTQGNLRGLEEAFYKAEQDYGINCLFVMAIASHESANGTICFKPNNMFGFGGSGFSSKAECIDVVARALENNYLTPGGGLYNGTRITDVNKRYAASTTWDDKVCRNMTRYYATISANHNTQLDKLK